MKTLLTVEKFINKGLALTNKAIILTGLSIIIAYSILFLLSINAY